MAKRYIDKSLEKQRAERSAGFSRRMENIADVGSGMYDTLSRMATGLAKEEVFGIPGLLGDLAEPAAALMNPVLYGTNPEIRENLSEFQKEFGAVGLAKAAGVELSDEFFDEKGELRPEMVGRMLAPGALYGKGAALLPELSAGVQSLVRGLKNDGFFPAGGPQPATVSGPLVRELQSDVTAAGPRSSVLMSEAQGTPTGGSKSLVQAEKEDMFVSPENPAVVESGPPDQPMSGLSETGVYLPVRAALMNIDIPKDGIAANKLLEKLRGQPRAGSELRATGFADYLKMKGTDKLSKDEIDLVYDGMSPAPVIRTVMHEPYRYAGQDVSGTQFGYNMQRQIGAKDTGLNYGVIAFGDEKNAIDGVATKTVDQHQYFGAGGANLLPSTFGHVRFSIQEMLDPVTQKPIKVLLVEEIQSDLVRAFAGADRAKRSVRSVDKIKNDLVKENPDLAQDDAALTLMAQTQHEEELAKAETVAARLLNNRAVYGPGEKLADATLDIHPDVIKYKQMTEQVKLAEDSDRIFNNPVMQKINQELDRGLASFDSMSNEQSAENIKFLLLNGLHKAKTQEEAASMLEKLAARGVSIPQSQFLSRQAAEANLNPQEILAERIKSLSKDVMDARRRAAAEQTATETTGIMAKLKNKFSGPTEDVLAEKVRDGMISTMAYSMKEAKIENYATQLFRKNKNKLLEARQKNLDTEDTIDFFDLPDLNKQSIKPDPQSQAAPKKIRKQLNEDEVLSSINQAEFDGDIDDIARLLSTELRMLEEADPIFRGSARTYDYDFAKTAARRAVLGRVGSSKAASALQLENYKENVLNKIADAKQNAPTPRDMVSQISKILDDEKGVGDLFRRRYNLDNDTTAMDIAANPQILEEDMLGAEHYISRPPFETQNDFIQFAMRAIASEAKKLEVDAVVVPPVEEMVMARAEHQTVAKGRDGIKQIEDFKVGLAREKEVREAIQKLNRMDDDKVLTPDDIEALNLSSIPARFGTPKTAAEFKLALKNDFINMGSGRVDHLRGHFQNYGESLNAALSNLQKQGFDVSELEALNVKKRNENAYTPLGEYARQGRPDLAKYRMIDLREGKKGADIAKKVPSLYNKGGHVDVRGGIGAMARSVM